MDVKEPLHLPSPLQLQGFGLRLREWHDDDVTALVSVYDNPEVARWTPVPSPFDTDTALAYLAAAQVKRADGRGVQLAITTDGRWPLGEVLLFRSLNDPRDVELAYGVGPAHRGRGLASKAVRLVTEYATLHLNPRRVVLRIEAENTASEAVARSAGFELTDDEPVLRRHKDREVVLRTWCLR
ncbi:GNAT family N-acetyltransferase [Streptomyces phyllanthi]|uniref:GNAT family N-acetyltransferase n=1 Tax=Streptomyces phyllanthi TaxID=1803180 RepID=A0A5N8VXG5_9ACTN|nr:GNAT family N-acetyltransferase [Streptomyces phyllanthi]MPY39961.1 GNAT family N-acetyltransferase [Streptomyces phyllanthi]